MDEKMDEQYAKYLNSPEWAEKREQRLEMDGHRCVICHATENLEIHHVTYDRKYDEDVMHDLVTLCHNCHASVSGMLTYWEREEVRERRKEQEKEMERERAWRAKEKQREQHPTYDSELILLTMMLKKKEYFDAIYKCIISCVFLEFGREATAICNKMLTDPNIYDNRYVYPQDKPIIKKFYERYYEQCKDYDENMSTEQLSKNLTRLVQNIHHEYYRRSINEAFKDGRTDEARNLLNDKLRVDKLIVRIPDRKDE